MTSSLSSTAESLGTRKTGEPAKGGWLAFAAVVWLVLVLAALRRSLVPDSGDLALATAAGSLLQLTLAGILAGAAMGLWAAGQLARAPRALVTVAAGLLTGVLASAAVLFVRGMPGGAVWILALALGLAGAIGGGLSALRPQVIVYAGVIATLVNLVFFNVMQLNSSWLLRVFGADGTDAGNQAAGGYLSFTQALVAGLLGGYVAYRVVRRGAPASLRWPFYLLAGGIPGLLWIVGDIITRIGVSRLLTLASADPDGDKVIMHSLGASRINTGLVLFFIGGLTAMIAFGRTLKRPSEDEAV
jgi:hypothetical protein